MKCGNCPREQQDEPFWTSKKAGTTLMVCAECLYELDGIDYRGKSIGNVLKDIERKRKGVLASTDEVGKGKGGWK